MVGDTGLQQLLASRTAGPDAELTTGDVLRDSYGTLPKTTH